MVVPAIHCPDRPGLLAMIIRKRLVGAGFKPAPTRPLSSAPGFEVTRPLSCVRKARRRNTGMRGICDMWSSAGLIEGATVP